MLQLSKKESEESYSITMVRLYDKNSDNIHVEKVDGVLEYICNLDSTKHIRLGSRYMINTREDIDVTPNIKAKVSDMKYDEKGELAAITVTLFSTILRINDLRKWVDEVHRSYCFEKDNKLGKKKFYFNEIPVEPPREFDSSDVAMASSKKGKEQKVKYRLDSAPKHLMFSMNEFNTSKSFTNVFGNHVAELKERLDLFVNHPEWYMQRGIPHSLGIMLHGIPGAGKTSTIKAIAKDTQRHIFNLSLRPYTTQKQLLNLFFNENVMVFNDDGHKQAFRIPLNQRLFVIEDIDCLTNVVHQRTADSKNAEENGEAVTLSFLLNLLDGVLETPGRILVITSNFPEKLDTALVRPGRIDVKIRFDWASRELIASMIRNFYSVEANEEDIPAEVDEVLTPAEVLECLCNYFKDHRRAIECLRKKAVAAAIAVAVKANKAEEAKQFVGISASGMDGTILEDLESDEDEDSDSDSDEDEFLEEAKQQFETSVASAFAEQYKTDAGQLRKGTEIRQLADVYRLLKNHCRKHGGDDWKIYFAEFKQKYTIRSIVHEGLTKEHVLKGMNSVNELGMAFDGKRFVHDTVTYIASWKSQDPNRSTGVKKVAELPGFGSGDVFGGFGSGGLQFQILDETGNSEDSLDSYYKINA